MGEGSNEAGQERARPSKVGSATASGQKNAAPGKLTHTQGFPQSTADLGSSAIGAQTSAAETSRADPWLMDDASMAAMGLCSPGDASEDHDSRVAVSSQLTWWEPQLRAFLQMPGDGSDAKQAKLRLDLLLGTVRAMSAAERAALGKRLSSPRADDELILLFTQKLPATSLEQLRAAVRGAEIALEEERKPITHASAASGEADATASATAASPSSSDAMWRHVVGEASTTVGKLARVRAPKGVRVRTRPAPNQPDLGILPFDELVSVERRTEHGWCWVVPMGQSAVAPGFCEEQFLSLDPPEPTAHLHRVTPGSSLREIAESYYGKQFQEERDARLYVQALYEANKGHKGIYLTEVQLPTRQTIHRSEAEERTVEIYKGAKVREGHVLWVPSEAFIEQLRASGAITSGSSDISQLWRTAKAGVSHVVDAATYGAAFTVGLLEGSWSAIVDLFEGAVDMIELVAKTVYQLITGNLGAIKATMMGWVDKLKAAWAGRDKVADAFMQKWESEDAWTRGSFQGEVLGWVMMTALLILLTAGQGSIAMAAGKWASVLRVLQTVDALGDITTYVGKAARLSGKAAAIIRRRVGKGAEDLADAAGEAIEAEGDAARAITNAGEAGDSARQGNKGNKPDMEKVTTSLDGHTFHTDFRKLSGTARHIVRQLEARGWVRVSEILPEDLVQISKWFGKEIGVVQSPYGSLRVILGTEDGVMKGQIKAGELFLTHTHPVVSSLKKHFDWDLPRAGRHVETVIDWSGQVTYFNRSGIMNPIRPNGWIEPLLDYRAAFLSETGSIIGFADVDIIDSAAGVAIRVRK